MISGGSQHDPTRLPEDLPVPQDEGAARHLAGARLPALALPATDGTMVDLSALAGRTVVYLYPRTGRPGQNLPQGWDGIPGARGCTPQSCGFRDHFAELKSLGVKQLFGLSTQTSEYQREAVERLHLPFAILSDEKLALTGALRLPTFTVEGMILIRRMAWVVDDAVITKVFYPVFPPDRSAAEVVNWIQASR
jgi:peroxiredoxin